MLQRVKENKTINAVVVHKIDILARNIEDHVAIRAILRRYDVQLVSVTENIEDSASRRLVEGILATIAEFYSANLPNEVKKGMFQKAKKGGCPTQAPFGYRNIKDENGIAKVVIDEKEAHFVKMAYKLYATGNYSLKELKDISTKRGLRTRATKSKPAGIIGISP